MDDLLFNQTSPKKKAFGLWAENHYEKIADLVSNGSKFVTQLRIKFAENPQALDYFQERIFKAHDYFFPRWDALYFELLHKLELSKRQKGMKAMANDLADLEDDLLKIIIRVKKIKLWMQALQQNKRIDRKSTRLNSSHVRISYAVFCLKKKK